MTYFSDRVTTRQLVSYIIVLVVLVVSGLVLASTFGQDFFIGANKELSQSESLPSDIPIVPEVVNAEIRNITAVVEAVASSSLSIKNEQILEDQFDTRTIIIDDNTKIYSRKQKSESQLNAEMDEFTKNIQLGETISSVAAPSAFVLTPTTVDSISVGMIISVQADKDIKDIKSFTALEIIVQPSVFSVIPPMIR